MGNREKALPIEWEECDETDYDSCSFYNVRFTADFGSIKEGDKFTRIYIDFEEGFFQLYFENELVKIIHFKCTIKWENDKI
jgi:hypothetical protein